MKQLEKKEKVTEDIEEVVKQSPEKFAIKPTAAEVPEEPLESPMPKTQLLGKEREAQEVALSGFEAQEQVVPITELVDVDSTVINYGQFVCGKILGSTLLLSNVSDAEQLVTMSISGRPQFSCDETFGQYNRDELPFDYQDGSVIKNAEVEFGCWFIENPLSKELQKSITLRIGPAMSQEFIVVVKAPKNRISAKIVSFIDIAIVDDAPAKHLRRDSRGALSLEEVHPDRKMEVLLLGYLDNPRVRCVKQLFNQNAQTEIVPLVVRRLAGVQKFKLPFKNLSSYLDSDIEFAFIRTQTPPSAGFIDPIDCLSFYCQPNQLKIAADSVAVLGVQVKVNLDLLQDQARVNPKDLKKPQNKLLVARLKNSQVLFSFFVSITLVEGELCS
jgi:hypothetical protein